jgi:histidinol-phosphate aminotransferase
MMKIISTQVDSELVSRKRLGIVNKSANKIDLAKNENPFAVSMTVKSAIIKELNSINRYPEKLENEVRDNIAKLHDLHALNILLANGSSEIIDLIFRAKITQNSQIIIPEQTFVLYDRLARVVNAKLISIENDRGHQDLNMILSSINENTGIVVLVNPSNPMGYIIDSGRLEAFIRQVPPKTLIIIDEAYSEYVDDQQYQSAISFTKKYTNCVVIKTFSKAYGMGGLRIGYCAAHRNVIKEIERYTRPFMVNCLSLAAANAAISDELSLTDYHRSNREGLQQLTEGFERLELNYYGKSANFLTVRLPCIAKPVCEALENEAIFVKELTEYGLPDHIRVSVGLSEHNARFLAKLSNILKSL